MKNSVLDLDQRTAILRKMSFESGSLDHAGKDPATYNLLYVTPLGQPVDGSAEQDKHAGILQRIYGALKRAGSGR